MATTVGKPEVCPACLLPALRSVALRAARNAGGAVGVHVVRGAASGPAALAELS